MKSLGKESSKIIKLMTLTELSLYLTPITNVDIQLPLYCYTIDLDHIFVLEKYASCLI